MSCKKKCSTSISNKLDTKIPETENSGVEKQMCHDLYNYFVIAHEKELNKKSLDSSVNIYHSVPLSKDDLKSSIEVSSMAPMVQEKSNANIKTYLFKNSAHDITPQDFGIPNKILNLSEASKDKLLPKDAVLNVMHDRNKLTNEECKLLKGSFTISNRM